MSFKLKTTVLFILLSTIPIGIISCLVFIQGRSIIEQRTLDHLAMTNIARQEVLGYWDRHHTKILEIIASFPDFKPRVIDMVGKAEPGGQSGDFLAIRVFLNPFIQGQRYEELFITDALDGRVVISTDPRQEGKFKDDQDFFLKGRGGAFVQDIIFDIASGKPVMTFSLPIQDSRGQTVALLAGNADLKNLSASFERPNPLSRTEDTYLVNQFNYFITEPRFGREYALRKSISNPGLRMASKKGSFIGSYRGYRGEPVISAVQWLEKNRLYIVTEIDRSEAHEPIRRLKNQVLVIAVALTFISALIGGLISKTITRPLTALTEAVTRVGKGQFSILLDTSRKGELYDLARSFVGMASQLEATMVGKEKLEAEVLVRKEAEKELRKTVRALKQSNQDLQQFAYVASHDLQEPLRMVSSFTQLLADRYRDELDDKAQKWIHFAVDGATRMQRLIQDLLSFSRVNTHGRSFEQTHMKEPVEEALANLHIAVQETSARIDVDDLPTLCVDRGQMVMLFQNLISNAMKFCRDRRPQIRISSEKKEGRWVIQVADNGIGIEAEFADKIFIIFQRLHTREEYPGTGLGLAVCKRIVQRHQGQIWMKSTPGEGTVFHIALPEG